MSTHTTQKVTHNMTTDFFGNAVDPTTAPKHTQFATAADANACWMAQTDQVRAWTRVDQLVDGTGAPCGWGLVSVTTP